MNAVVQLILSTIGAAVVSGLIGWLIARQNRRASLDVARQETNAAVASTREESEREAYVRARNSLEGTIAALERENTRIQRVADAALAEAAACAQKARDQDDRIEAQDREIHHLHNQDQAKQRIIDRMAGELREAKAALRIAVHDDEDPGP